MNKRFLITAALFGALSVMLGAFGAHGLKGRMNAETFEIFETADQIPVLSCFCIACSGIISQYIPGRFLTWSEVFYCGHCAFLRLIIPAHLL